MIRLTIRPAIQPAIRPARSRRLGLAFALAFLATAVVFAAPDRAHADLLPKVTAVSPTQGPTSGGTPITVTGSDFQAGAKLYIGGIQAVGVMRVSSTQITGTTPSAGGGTGRSATVQVINPDGGVATLIAGFFLTAVENPLSITSIETSTGPNSGGTTVTIIGGGFNPAAAVRFGDVPATTVNVLGSSSIFARTPANVGTVPVIVINPDNTSARLDNAFTYQGGVAIASVVPGGGAPAGGTTIQVIGNGFRPGATVKIGSGTATAVTYINSTRLIAVTPPGNLGPANVTVTNTDGTSSSVTGFTYGPGPNAVVPKISAISPVSGSSLGGTQVTMSGVDFSGGAAVYFGGVPSPSISWNGTSSMFVRTPSNVSGPVAIMVINGDGASSTLADAYTYLGPDGLALTGMTPTTASSSGGTLISIAGNGINPGSWVTFNGVPAPISTVIGTTQIVATTPPGLTGAVTVAVTQIGGVSATAPVALTIAGATAPPPVVVPPVTSPPPVAGGSGAFLVTPIFSTSGQALVIFGGGSTDQLEAAAGAAQATGAWVQDATGAYQLLVVGGPSFLKEAFQARFAAGIAVNTPAALTR